MPTALRASSRSERGSHDPTTPDRPNARGGARPGRAPSPARAGDPLAVEPLDLAHRLTLLASGLRWGTVCVGILVGLLHDPSDPVFLCGGIALVAHALLLSLRPRPLDPPDRAVQITVLIELVLTVTVATLTGGVDSPFVLTSAVPIVLAGYSWGRRLVGGVTIAGLVATVAVVVAQQADADSQRSAAGLGVVFLLCGVLGASTRRLVADLNARQAVLDHTSRMATANELLVALHGVARTLPASLDLADVLDSARARLSSLLELTALTVFVHDDATGTWTRLGDGARDTIAVTGDELPPVLARTPSSTRPTAVTDHLAAGTTGCTPGVRSGLYAPLRTRDRIVGLLAVEHDTPGRYGRADADLLAALAVPLALAVDNARWFARLRRFGAEAERARIARDLHDRLAQDLAYVAFELERLAATGRGDELQALRDVVRGLVGELRETLYELRAGVSAEQSLVDVVGAHLVRFGTRTGTAVEWTHDAAARLPVPVEQELWRILQEALTNVERHAGASTVRVTWSVDGSRATLSVEDDGRGFDPATVGADRFGLLGMRERADAVGARLGVRSAPGAGTAVVVELEVAR